MVVVAGKLHYLSVVTWKQELVLSIAINLYMPVINFNKEKSKRDDAEQRAENLIQYIRDNCTQNSVMLDLLDQPFLKKEIAKTLHNFKGIEDKMNVDKK